jgi:hypothetical protein
MPVPYQNDDNDEDRTMPCMPDAFRERPNHLVVSA